MNTEMLDRIMTAKAYQKKAIHALFPEEMNGHLEVIERELKMMAEEVVQSLLRDIYESSSAARQHCGAEKCTMNAAEAEKRQSRQTYGKRKIDIV